MSRFKFACNCGKRLAAYDWMVGRILSCPKCGRTLTIPTPFQAEDKLEEMQSEGYDVSTRKLGVRVEEPSRLRLARMALLIGIAVLATAAVLVIAWFLT